MLISALGMIGTPAYSIRTYFNEPELSSFTVPPCHPLYAPSNSMLAPWLFAALPQITTPPQSPGLRAPTG